MMARKSFDDLLGQVEKLTGIMGDHMTSLRVMQDTLHFQASFVGDQGESYERFTKEVGKHMKEMTGTSKAHREAIEATNEWVT